MSKPPKKFMKIKTQDPKFQIELFDPSGGSQSIAARLVGQSGPIPDDEPLFIIRARDVNAIDTLDQYYEFAKTRGADADHLAAIERRIKDFSQFCHANPDRMGTPDTNLAQMQAGYPRKQQNGGAS